MQAAPRSLGLQMTVVDASAETEIEAAFAALAQENAGALLLNMDPLLLGKR